MLWVAYLWHTITEIILFYPRWQHHWTNSFVFPFHISLTWTLSNWLKNIYIMIMLLALYTIMMTLFCVFFSLDFFFLILFSCTLNSARSMRRCTQMNQRYSTQKTAHLELRWFYQEYTKRHREQQQRARRILFRLSPIWNYIILGLKLIHAVSRFYY